MEISNHHINAAETQNYYINTELLHKHGMVNQNVGMNKQGESHVYEGLQYTYIISLLTVRKERTFRQSR